MNWLDEVKLQYKEDRFFKEVFEMGIYADADRGGKIILDVGGCGGEFSYWLYDSADALYLIEPEPKQFAEVKAIKEKYNLDKLHIFNFALFDKNGIGTLGLEGRGSHSMVANKPDSIQVETKTLATFMKENGIDHIDVMKIDVEDAENTIFSAADFPEVSHKIKFIIGEHGNGNGILANNGFRVSEAKSGWKAER